jgi:hypothetical protein
MLEEKKVTLGDGYYTVAFKNKEYGEGHRTFRIRTQKQHEWRGDEKARLVSLLIGADNTHDYMRIGEVKPDGTLKVWNRFQHDEKTLILKCLELLFTGNIADKAGKFYALKSNNCYRCGRLLTHQESIAQGIGPCCGGWVYKENSKQAKQRKAKKELVEIC